ncbi:MAG: dienelactone hydrolase family protein [Deltaproteobacteria bacterium]|nr:dienelactone hydrolase family protein [Deltaproteobacteria bacterium]
MSRWDLVPVDGRAMRILVDGPERDAAAVVVLEHGPGIDRFIEDRVARLAERGWIVAAPDLFHRQPDDGAPPLERVARLRDPELLADLTATVAYLRARGVTAMAVIGFCMGGRCTYLAAAALPDAWRAAGVFYGGNILVPWGDGIPSPFERSSAIACPMIGFFGNEDPNPSPADVDEIDAELARLGVPHDFHRYDGAGHAFLNFTNAERYRPHAADDAWPRLLAFLDAHLS